MTDDSPGSLSQQQYVDIVAYIDSYGYPSGADSLSTDPEALRLIRLEAKKDLRTVLRQDAVTKYIHMAGVIDGIGQDHPKSNRA